jgi:acetoin utilization deacetylase AcuC-like enzyme
MRLLYCPGADIDLQQFGIAVPLSKNRAREVLRRLPEILPQQKVEWLEETPFTYEELAQVHTPDYCHLLFHHPDQAVLAAYELIDQNGRYVRYDPAKKMTSFEKLVDVHLTQAKATYRAGTVAVESGEAVFHLGGGMHHAMSFGGRGFCLIHDLVLTAVHLKKQKKIENCWIVDVDAHKGDGSAELGQKFPWLSTLSIHMEKGWPLDGADRDEQTAPWLIPSTLDIPIGIGQEKSYLEKLQRGLEKLLVEKSRPDLILVALGADPWEADELPSASLLKLSLAQMLERDKLVYNFTRRLQVPVVFTMAGGYGERSWEPYLQFIVWANGKNQM